MSLYASKNVEVSGRTRVFGIIGDPIEHTLSPLFQSRFLDQSGIDAVYVPFHVKKSRVNEALEGLWAVGVEGFNVTVPHKEALVENTQADADAKLIGAVNTVRRQTDGWNATNTDWKGFHDVLVGLQHEVQGAKVLMFGSGGTSRAVMHALSVMGVRLLNICNRSQQRLQALLAHAGKHYPGLNVEAVAWDQKAVQEAASKADVLVNTTSIGLEKEHVSFPFALAGKGLAIDAVYTPDGHTPFVTEAEKAGRLAVDGLPMLIAQGAASFSFWHGMRPDRVSAMHWLESRLDRSPQHMPGWETVT